jgi:hypothetical protein
MMLKRTLSRWTRALNHGRDVYQDLSLLSRQALAMGRRVDDLGVSLDEMKRELRLVLSNLTLPPDEVWRNQPPVVAGAPAACAFPYSTMCRQESFQADYFPYWTAKIGQALRYHRKLWEFVFICQALWERGALQPGARGLGFGVGVEPLSAFFASQDCQVIATDMGGDEASAQGWAGSLQHAAGKEALRAPWVCPDSLFDSNVSYRTCDMNHIPANLTGFDFCWSACALEHLGSIEKGLKFIENSVDCLKPGGWAVHTTEFNLSSNDQTVDNLNTVLFRRRDFEALAARLAAKGHTVAPFDFEPGARALDRYIDVAPYRAQPHLVLALMGYATTSFGIIVQRAP